MTEPIETVETVETVETIETTETVEPAPTRTQRGRVRWYHVVVLGVAVLACAAAVGFATSQSSDRDEAESTRRAAQAALTAERSDTAAARDDLAATREDTKAALAEMAQLNASLHELTDLTSQEVDALVTANQLAVNSPDDVDGFNAQVDRGTALLDQMRTKTQAIEDQVNQLRDRTNAQFAVITLPR